MIQISRKVWSIIASAVAFVFPFLGNDSAASSQKAKHLDYTPGEVHVSQKAEKKVRSIRMYLASAIKRGATDWDWSYPQPEELKGQPNYIIVHSASPRKSHRFPAQGRWKVQPDRTLQKKDREGNQLIMKHDGSLLLLDRNGKYLGSKKDPAAAQVYKAIMKSVDMQQKSGLKQPQPATGGSQKEKPAAVQTQGPSPIRAGSSVQFLSEQIEGMPTYMVWDSASPRKSYKIQAQGRWKVLADKSLQKKDRDGNRLVMKKDGTLKLYNSSGKYIGGKKDPTASEVYKAIMTSAEMKEKAK
jgi:hypothetical protein